MKQEKNVEDSTKELKSNAESVSDDVQEYMEEESKEVGYKQHTFSLLDNPLEIATVAFIFAYLVFKIWRFVNYVEEYVGLESIFDYWLGVVAGLIPAVILLVAAEIYEKIELMDYNVKLNSYYMAQYQMDMVNRMEQAHKKSAEK